MLLKKSIVDIINQLKQQNNKEITELLQEKKLLIEENKLKTTINAVLAESQLIAKRSQVNEKI